MSSSRPILTPQIVINNGSMAGNLTSLVTIIQNISMISYSYSWSGTSPVGTISVQVSNDYAQNAAGVVTNAGTWNTLTFNLAGSAVTSAPVSGNTGNGLIDIGPTAPYAIRTVYTASSGTGTLTAIISAKVT